MHSWNSPWQWGSWKVRLANAEGAVSRQYQCSHWSLCLLNIQAFLPASSMKNSFQTLTVLAGTTFTSDPTRNACSTFQEAMRLLEQLPRGDCISQTSFPASWSWTGLHHWHEHGWDGHQGLWSVKWASSMLSHPSWCLEIEESQVPGDSGADHERTWVFRITPQRNSSPTWNQSVAAFDANMFHYWTNQMAGYITAAILGFASTI